MPFIGTQPEVGGYSVLDALTASATASYTLQLNSANFIPASANQLLVSLNGVIQKPGSSFTVSGSTLTFSSALTSSDSIDFIISMGEPLLIGTPSDGTVTTNKLVNDSVTGAKIENNPTIAGNLTVSGTSTNTGLITASAGVAVGGTGSANTLDDYEEGTHQTAITMTGSGSVTLNTSFDRLSYTKVGRLVTITGHPRIASVSSPVGSMYLSLPFVSKNGEQDECRSGGVFEYYDNSAGSGSYYKLLGMQLNQNSNLLSLNNTHTHNFNVTPAASDEIYLNFCYITS